MSRPNATKMQPLNISDNPDDDEETLSFLPHPKPPLQNITLTTGHKTIEEGKGDGDGDGEGQGQGLDKTKQQNSNYGNGNPRGNSNRNQRKSHRQQRQTKTRTRQKRKQRRMKKNYYENIDEDDLFYDASSEGNNNHFMGFNTVRRKGFCLPWMIETISFMMIIASIVVVKALYRDGHFQQLFGGDNDNNNKDYDISFNYYNDNLDHRGGIRQWEDLHLDDIQHWCLNHTVTDCKCSNPLTPNARHGHSTWSYAYHQNIKNARNSAADDDRNYDVVFLGDSILEGFKGTKFGKEVRHKQDNVPIFESLFNVEKGAEYDGLILAIAGDKSPNLLWRLENGELPTKLKPKIFWILIGTNDFLKDGLENCSEEVVLMGIQRVVGEIQSRKPESMIVINGILPRAEKGNEGMLYVNGSGRGSDRAAVSDNESGDGSMLHIMDAIDGVNKKLSEFCDTHENLHYFDARDIFVDSKEELQTEGKVVEHFIPQSLMADYLHPTSLGYQKWGRKIVDEIRSLLDGELEVI